MRGFFILFLAVFLWSLAFFSLYCLQVRRAGLRETVLLLNRLFLEKKGYCCGEEENSVVFRFAWLAKWEGCF